MKTVRFTQTAVIDFLQGKGEEVFKEGEEYPLEDDQADRWIRRGKAVDTATVEKSAEEHQADFDKLAAKAKAKAKSDKPGNESEDKK